ncbi:MAG: hypothetical protein ABW151_17815 [Pseudorhodoplanes sp.]
MKLKTFVVLGAMTLASAAHAQHKHGHEHVEKGPNGGSMSEAGDFHIELIAKDANVEINVMDHDNKPVATAGFKGIAILSAGGKSVRIVLEPGDVAKLTGKAQGALPAQPKGVVQITPPNGKTVQAKFN